MSLPIVLPGNASATLKDMLSGSNNQTNLFDLKKLQVYAGQQGNQTGNAESFFMGSKFEKIFQFLKRLTETVIGSIVKANDALHEKLSEMNNNLVLMIKAINDMEFDGDDEPEDGESPFEDEQKAKEKVKMKKKEIGLLEAMLKQMGNNALGWLSPSLLKKYKMNESKSSFGFAEGYLANSAVGQLWGSAKEKSGQLLGGAKEKGGAALRYIGSFKAVQMLSKGVTKLGSAALTFGKAVKTYAMPFVGVYGMLKESLTGEITGGKKLTGIRGGARVVGAGIAQMMSFLTFGLVDAKTIYPYLAEATNTTAETIKTLTLGMLTGLKDGVLWIWDTFVMPIVDAIDGQLSVAFGKQYDDIKKATKQKLEFLKEGAINISKKVWGMLTSSVDWAYDKYLDYINWVEAGAEIKSFTGSDLLHRGLNYLMGNKKLELGERGMAHEAGSRLADKAQYRIETENDNPEKHMCYAGVKKSYDEAGMLNPLEKKQFSGESAYMAANQLASIGFEEDSGGRWLYSGAEILKTLGPGYTFVINKGDTEKTKPGHVAITLGEGLESSDRVRPIGSQTIARANKYGYRVFKPTRANKGYNSTGVIANPTNTQDLSSSYGYETGLNVKTPDLGYADVKSMMFDSKLDTTNAQDSKIGAMGVKIVSTGADKSASVPEPIISQPIINNTSINNISSNDTSTSFGDTLNKILNWTSYLNLNRRTP